MPKLIAILIFLSLSGCAIFEGGNVPKTALESYQGAEGSKPSLSYTTYAEGGLQKIEPLPEEAQKIIEEEFTSVLNSSGYFQSVTKGEEKADIAIKMKIVNTGDPSSLIGAVITGLSLYTIPSWATDNFKVVAEVTRKDGLSKTYELKDTTKIVQWLPMMFAFPFNNFSVITEVRQNMYRKVLADMQKDGFFDAPANTVSLVY